VRVYSWDAMKRYALNSERIIHFMGFLREVPYINSEDYIRFFYPNNKNKTYALDTLRSLCQRNMVQKHRLNDGSNIYYLTEDGVGEAEGYAEYRPKFSRKLGCIYYVKLPRVEKEKPSFLYFPTPELELRRFSYSMLSSYQYLHTRAILEFLYLVRRSNRVLYSVFLDMIKGKKSGLGIHCNPDILLTNDIKNTESRILIEFENSKIWEAGLVEKLNNLSKETADYIIFISSSDGIFRNLGRIISKLMTGQMKKDGLKNLPSKQTIQSLESRILFGLWRPSYSNGGEVQKLSDIYLFRHDSAVFNGGNWEQKTEDGRLLRDDYGNPIMVFKPELGISEGINLADLLGEFQDGFKNHLLSLSNEQATDTLS
jgi:hypothetical protein